MEEELLSTSSHGAEAHISSLIFYQISSFYSLVLYFSYHSDAFKALGKLSKVSKSHWV